MAIGVLKSLKPPMVSLKNMIHGQLATWEDPRPHFPLRASDLMRKEGEFCPREHAFMDLKVATKKGMFVGTSLRMTFTHGAFMEDKIRNDYLRHLAVGEWACGVCGHTTATFGKAPQGKCPKCGWGHQWNYVEPRFADPYTGVSGGIDMLLDTKAQKLLIVEIKTMTPEDFKTLAAPLAEHKFRTALYLRLASASEWAPSDRVNQQEAKILYVTKSFGFKDESLKLAGIKDAPFSPFKEFTVVREDSLVATPLAKARVLKVWREDQKGMPCGVCANGLTKRAQGCPAVAPCWSGKYQSTLTWLEHGLPRHADKTLVV